MFKKQEVYNWILFIIIIFYLGKKRTYVSVIIVAV